MLKLIEGNPGYPSIKSILLVLTLISAVAAVYIPSVPAPFYHDDYPNIVYNPGVHFDGPFDFEKLQHIPQGRMWKRTLAFISFGINWAYTGKDPGSYRLINIGLHAVNTVLIFLLISALLPLLTPDITLQHQKFISFTSALLWGLHPLNTQPVVYVVQRMTLLSAFFTLLMCISYLYIRRDKPILRYSLSLLFLILGFYSKESAVLVPIALVGVISATDYYASNTRERLVRRALQITIPLLLAVTAFVTFYSGSPFDFSVRPFTMWERLLTQFRALVFYLSEYLFPLPNRLALIHDWQASSSIVQPISTLFSFLFLVILFCAALKYRKRFPVFSASIVWFLILHLLESTILPLELVYEHRNYLPTALLGAALITSGHRITMNRTRNIRVIAALMLIMVLTSFGYLTSKRNLLWTKSSRFIESNFDRYPNSARLGIWRARDLRFSGNIAGAEKVLTGLVSLPHDQIIVQSPGRGLADLYVELGEMYTASGRISKAEEAYTKAFDSFPDYPPALLSAGRSYLASKRAFKAVKILERAVAVQPDYPDVWYWLTAAYLGSGQRGKAIRTFDIAVKRPATDRNLYSSLVKELGIPNR